MKPAKFINLNVDFKIQNQEEKNRVIEHLCFSPMVLLIKKFKVVKK